ncbi:MAG: HEAT repeat domain-containing protein [Bryobacteraceae bacterium]|jgi:HEAT repeat protein
MRTKLPIIFLLLLPGTALLAQPEKTSWDVLKAGLSDKNPDKRRQAVTAIGSIGLDSDGLQLIEGALRDTDPLVRQTAAAELGQMKAREAIPSLKTAMEDVAGEVAFAAAKALWDMGDRSGRDLIEDVLTGQQSASEVPLKGAIRDAKRKMHDPKALAVMGFNEASGVLLGPFNIGIIAAEQAFKTGSSGGRAVASTLLAQDCDAESLRLLEWSSTSDKSWAVKAASAKALGQCGNPDAIPTLEQNLADSNAAVRSMSAGAIIKLTRK